MAYYPQIRLRRLRRTESLRALVRENHVDIGDLIYPLFVVEGTNIVQEIPSMPGINHFSIDKLREQIDDITALRIPAIILFGIP